MPQADKEVCDLMEKWFGSPIDEGPPLSFLLSRGYKEKNGFISHEVMSHKPTEEENICIEFLICEWDFSLENEYFNYLRNQKYYVNEHGELVWNIMITG